MQEVTKSFRLWGNWIPPLNSPLATIAPACQMAAGSSSQAITAIQLPIPVEMAAP